MEVRLENTASATTNNDPAHCGLLDRQVGRLLTLENAAGVYAGLTVRIRSTASVAH